jgi:aspartate racemase
MFILGDENMKIIGLIGGMSWESTLEYYRIINETVKLSIGDLHSAKCIIYSVDFEKVERMQHENKWGELTDIMVDIAKKLKNAGADFIIICTNTMHKMARNIEERAQIKVIHIADVAGKEILNRKMKKVGLLGTCFTMEQDFYKKVLKDNFNIDVIIPNREEREIIHKVIYDELCKGIINEESKAKYIKIINNLVLNGAEGIILGCTEIPLLIKQEDIEVTIFDTTKLHSIAAVEFALS